MLRLLLKTAYRGPQQATDCEVEAILHEENSGNASVWCTLSFHVHQAI